MEYVILGLLFLKPMTVYDLNKAFEQRLSLFYSASLGSIQTALKKLIEKAWVEMDEVTENGRNKKVYNLRLEGRRAFYDWMAAPIPLNKLEVVMLSKIFFLGLIESREERISIVRHMLGCAQQVEMGLSQIQTQYEGIEIPEEAQVVAMFQLKTLDYGVHAHRFAIGWLERLLEDMMAEEF